MSNVSAFRQPGGVKRWLRCPRDGVLRVFMAACRPTSVVFVYHLNLVLCFGHSNFVSRAVVVKPSVLNLILYIAFALYSRSCITSGNLHCIEDVFRGGMVPFISTWLGLCTACQLCFEIVRGCIFHISQAYLEFRRTVEVDGNSLCSVRRSSYITGDGFVYDISAREVPDASDLWIMK